jgi:serine/threonine protein kinase
MHRVYERAMGQMQAVDLLHRLLYFNPRERCTAEEALAHLYFSQVPLREVPESPTGGNAAAAAPDREMAAANGNGSARPNSDTDTPPAKRQMSIDERAAANTPAQDSDGEEARFWCVRRGAGACGCTA